MLNFNTTLANKIFVKLATLLEDEFGENLDTDKILSPVVSRVMEQLKQIDPSICFYRGASKMVIATPNLGGVVIKVPFSGRYNLRWVSQEKEEEDEPWNERYEFRRFSGGAGRYDDDYCLLESQVYDSLAKAGFAEFAAKTEILGWIDNKCIIIQEEVIPEEDNMDFHDYSYKSKEASEEMQEDFSSMCAFSDDFLALLIERYGEKVVRNFFYYCEEEEGGQYLINDIHDGNYGYRAVDGSPCLLDFSGYDF